MANEADTRAEELFRQTRGLAPARRTEFIRQACGGGETLWNLAEAKDISNARRKQLYREARGWYERALALYNELKRDAKLEARVAKKTEAMVSAIADCDREIAKY